MKPRAVKLLTDFDGIWTNQEVEASFVKVFIIKMLTGMTGKSSGEVEGFIEEIQKEMDKEPHENGWIHGGAAACFYREDPFGDNNAIFSYIEKNADHNSVSIYKQKLAELRLAIRNNGFATAEEFSNDCFLRATSSFRESGKLMPHSSARRVLEKLVKAGIDVVVVSNSRTDKIEHLFMKMNSRPSNERSIKRSRVHALGNAMKFVVDDSFTELPRYLEVTKYYKVPIRRRSYYEILKEELPDFVLGDVFSLDIALPLYLAMYDRSFNNLKIIQKVHPYTPAWVTDFLGRKEFKDKAYMIKDIEELPGLLVI